MVEFKVREDGSWELINKGSPELSTGTMKDYASLFELDKLRKTYGSIRVLIIGGGDYQLVCELLRHYDVKDLHIDLVDPCVKEYKPYIQYMNPDVYDLLSTLNITDHSMLFSEFVGTKETNDLYDLVIVDCSSFENLDTEEIYRTEFLETLERCISTREVKMYVDSTYTHVVRDFLKSRFIKYKLASKYVPEWEETPHVYHF